MAKESMIVGLDVGTTKVCCTVGLVQEGLVNIVGFSKVPNLGMRKGQVSDVEDCISAISASLEEAERMAGIPISAAVVSIGGIQINCTTSKGVVAVSRADGEITSNDVTRVIEAARTVALPPNREIIHVIPKSYTVDGQSAVDDPVGMTGIRLETEAVVIGGASSAIKNLSKCIQQSGLQISGLVFSPIATAQVLLSKKQKEQGVMILDLGGGTTSLAVFEEGEITHCAVIPVGSMHITNDIAIGVRTSLEVAEKIKLNYAQAMPDKVMESQIINLSNFDPRDTQKIDGRYVAEIIHARLIEIFSLVREELRKIGKDGMLPAGVVFTGGGSKIEDILELAKEELRLPALQGQPIIQIEGLVDKLNDPVYATSVGLMLWGLENSSNNRPIVLKGFLGKARNIFRHFIP